MLWIRLGQDAYVDLTFANDVTWDGSVRHDCFSVDAFMPSSKKTTKKPNIHPGNLTARP